MNSEKGQGVIEHAIILSIMAIIAIVVLAIIAANCLWIPALAAILFAFWTQISAWGAALVAGVIALNPMAIFTATVILIILAFVIFGRRRS